jgi:hypothetical protein
MSKRNLFFLVLVLFLIAPDSFCQNWDLRLDKDGIKVYTRKIGGSNVQEFRGETTVKSNMSGILTLIDDISEYPKWQNNCRYAERIKKINKRSGYSYYVIKTPWPISDRDIYTYYKVTQDTATKIVTVTLQGIKDYLPEQAGKVRIPSMKGFWQLTPVKKGVTNVVCQVHCETGGIVPAVITNAYITETPYFNLLNLKKIVESPIYPKTVMEGVKELE